MSSIEEINKRRITVGNIYKTTKAMELVSIAKSKKYQKKLFSSRSFRDDIYGIINSMLEDREIKKHELFKERKKTGKTLWIVFTSDMGLCGAFNNNIIKLIKPLINKKDIFIVKGIKGISGLKSKLDVKAYKQYERVNDENFIILANEIQKEILSKYWNYEIDSVNMVWTKYINQITYIPTITRVLPLSQETFLNVNYVKHSKNEIEFEPNIDSVLESIIPQYMVATLYSSLIETSLSEFSARRVAMENAKNNGEELMEELSIQYNKARQQKITQELTEIIAGSEADREN